MKPATGQYNWDEAPITLTVSFLPTPKKTEVKFHFELFQELGEDKYRSGFQTYCKSQFDAFLKHFND
jgi:hypothetical protein